MCESAEKFNTAMSAWREWQEAPGGRLRYALAEANLGRHLEGLPGGDGGDAVRLAARGHRVTTVDYAPAMLAAAVERAEASGLTELITCVRADVHALPVGLATGEFNVVLCHSLLQYVDDARPTLSAALARGVSPSRQSP
ncbi:methyltransferase [Streptomyces chrestomyceticus JCM 4735]|uniref:Methyltransferase n=1 Tax=Streptomyces chrestomyceticus JCM 4735 TaxID=1306181 RepID=A0A7U9KNW7_9ACTN|nr:class I SAM-dependent methyltransferase [Streptomyces chrestomyceticus]GCD32715.1 methyltransferase [Streptomyces chrestomyceticus JCM 4735]